MAMQYRKVNVPIIVIQNLKKKQIQMQQVVKDITGKDRRIPLTKVMVAVSQKPIYLMDHEIKLLTKKKVFKI